MSVTTTREPLGVATHMSQRQRSTEQPSGTFIYLITGSECMWYVLMSLKHSTMMSCEIFIRCKIVLGCGGGKDLCKLNIFRKKLLLTLQIANRICDIFLLILLILPIFKCHFVLWRSRRNSKDPTNSVFDSTVTFPQSRLLRHQIPFQSPTTTKTYSYSNYFDCIVLFHFLTRK